MAFSLEHRLLADRLKRARKAARLTQRKIAFLMGKHQSWVSKCENGERRVDAVELAHLAHLYGKPLSYFLPDPRNIRVAPARGNNIGQGEKGYVQI